MKKVLALVLCFVMCLSFVACTTEKADIEDFITQIKDQVETSDETGEMKLVVRGNSLVYSYKYKVDLGDNLDVVKDALESAMENSDSTYTEVLSQLRAVVKEADSVIVEFLSKDGKVIYSKEYK